MSFFKPEDFTDSCETPESREHSAGIANAGLYEALENVELLAQAICHHPRIFRGLILETARQWITKYGGDK